MTDTAPSASPSPVGWRSIVVLLLVTAAAAVAQSFGRFTYPIVLPAVRDYFGISNTVAGSLGSVNVGAYLAGTMVVAALASSMTLVRLMRLGLLLSVSGLALLGFSSSVGMVGLALTLTGLGGAAIWIPAPRLAMGALPPRMSGTAAGLAGVGIALGLFAVGRVAPALSDGVDGTPAWQRLYRGETIIGVLVLLGVIAFLRDRGRPASAGGFGGFGALRTVRQWRPLVAAYASFGFMYLLVLAFFSARLVDDAGFTKAEASSRYELIGLAGMAGGLALGRFSDAVGRGRALTAAFLGFALSTALVLGGEPLWVGIGAAGIGFSFSGIPSVIAAAVVDGTDDSNYGPAYAAATLAFGIAQMLAPQFGGWVADLTGSFTATFLVAIATACLGAACASRLRY